MGMRAIEMQDEPRLQRAKSWAAILAVAMLVPACTARKPPPAPTVIRPAAPVVTTPAEAPTPAEIASNQIIWALRGGLNVAALLCPDRSITDNYNQILKVHRTLLNEAYAAEQSRYRQLHGGAGIDRHSRAMTKLYNGFASVPDRRRFCMMATRIAADVVAMPSTQLATSARRALTTLEPGAVQLVNSAS
jgi:hypothetical protein